MGKLKLRFFLFLLLASLIIYSNSLTGDFLLDDYSLIVNNEYIKHIKTIPLLFTTHVFNFSVHSFETNHSYYRPLQTLSFAFDYRIWRMNSLGFHLTNIIIHSLNAFLVFYLIYRLFSNYPLALLTSVLFCIHPIQTESVSFISGRSELLVSLFSLLSLMFYLLYAKSKKWPGYLISLVSFIFALLSREAGFLILLPFVILALGIRSKVPKDSLGVHFFSFVGILAIYIRLRLTILAPIKSFLDVRSNFLSDVLNLLNILIEYIYLLLLPHALHIFRSLEPVSLVKPLYAFIPILFLASLIIISIVCVARKKYVVLFGIGWFVLTLLYLIKAMHKFEGVIAMEEHWVYLACIGFFVVIAYLILSIKKRVLARILITCIIITYGFLTFINSGHWREEIAFYRYNLRLVEPLLSIIPRLNFSTALYKRGLYQEAISQVNFILSLAPSNLFAYVQLGDIFKAMKKFPEAKEAYKEALKIDYFCWQANRRLKALAEELGERYIDDIDPNLSSEEARIISFIRMGEFSKAIEALRQAMPVSPTPQLYTLCGITFGKIGLYNQAIEAFNAALKIDPNYYLALYNLAVVYENKHELKKVNQIRKELERTRSR